MHTIRNYILGLVFASLASSVLAAPPTDTFQIVESVPQATDYGASGVPRTQAVWLQMIRGAHRHIDVAAFYISNKPGSALEPVLKALIQRAGEGVRVRILVGQSFMRISRKSVARLRKVKGITVRVLPVPKLTGGVLHAKYMIVDGRSVFVGSQNWDWRALTQIHEIGVRVRNARFARTFESAYDALWTLAARPDMPAAAKRAVRPLPFTPVTARSPAVLHDATGGQVIAFPAFSPPSMLPHGLDAEQPALVRLIRSSQHTLRVQVMTLSAIREFGPKGWWTPVDAALRDAAARGVEVRIIVANWALREPMQAYLKSLAVLPHVTVKFSTLPLAPQGFIPYARVEHAKYAVADDDRIYIGTGNWGWSYFNNTVDASVFAYGRSAAQTLVGIFDHDWNGPYVTTLEPGRTYKPPRKS